MSDSQDRVLVLVDLYRFIFNDCPPLKFVIPEKREAVLAHAIIYNKKIRERKVGGGVVI